MTKTSPNLNTEKPGIGSRFSSGKPSGWWYAPIYGLRLVAPVWQHGAEKYTPMDWKEGQSYSSLIDCAMRHMLEICERGPLAIDKGHFDEEGVWHKGSGAYHAAHVVWNMLCMLTFIALGRTDLNDVDEWRGVTAEE